MGIQNLSYPSLPKSITMLKLDNVIAGNNVCTIDEKQYKKLDTIIQTVKTMSRALYQSVYIIDYHKNEFLYVSDNPLFLCGHTAKEIKDGGYSVHAQHVSEEEIKKLLEINRVGFKFFEANITQEDRHLCYFTYDFHIPLNGKKALINHKLMPMLFTKDGRIWIAICIVSLSTRSFSRDLELHFESSPRYWRYNLSSHKWDEKRMIELSNEEKIVLQLCSQGFTIKEIAEIMCRSVDTIKFYRRSLFEKTKKKNIIGVLNFANLYKLL